jgi:hypothetical protein
MIESERLTLRQLLLKRPWKQNADLKPQHPDAPDTLKRKSYDVY